jgi:hypothetical protein
MLNKSRLAMIALAASSMSINGGAEILLRQSRGYGHGPMPKGCTRGPVSKAGNPAGTKLARKAAKGRLGLR